MLASQAASVVSDLHATDAQQSSKVSSSFSENFQKSQLVRVEVLGDEKVGKTSMICSLVSRHFNEKVPPTLLNVRIPAEDSKGDIILSITDTSPAKAMSQRVTTALDRSDAILLIFDITRPETFSRLIRWLELIAKQKPLPVVLVANKADLQGPMQPMHSSYESRIRKLLKTHQFVVAAVECSTKVFAEVARAFYFAQKAVLYPTEPLYNSKERRFEPDCLKAIRRAFRLYNKAGNGIMSREELNDYQQDCYGIRLSQVEMDALMELLTTSISNGVTHDSRGLYLGGFEHLWRLFIDQNRPESCWQVLRGLGYSNKLKLEIPPSRVAVPEHEEDQSAYLSNSAIHFLTRIFHQFSSKKDGFLREEDISEIFSILDQPIPPWMQLPHTMVFEQKSIDGHIEISLPTWLACWNATAHQDPKLVLRVLFYLGFNDKEDRAIQFTQRRSLGSRSLRHERQVIACYVYTSCKDDYISFMNAFVGKQAASFDELAASDAGKSLVAINKVNVDGEDYKYLLLLEIVEPLESMHLQLAQEADIVCCLYNPWEPLALSDLQEKLQEMVPSMTPIQYVAVRPSHKTREEWDIQVSRLEASKSRLLYFDSEKNGKDIFRHLVLRSLQPRIITSSVWWLYTTPLLLAGAVSAGIFATKRSEALQYWLQSLPPTISAYVIRPLALLLANFRHQYLPKPHY